jgi:hypothetical protein
MKNFDASDIRKFLSVSKFQSPPYSDNSVNLNLNPIKADEAQVSTLSIPPKAETFPDRNLFIKDPEPEMQVNIIESDTNVTNVKYISKDRNVNSQNVAFEEEEFEESGLQPSLSDSEDPPVAVAIDWDSDENHQRRFWARVMDEKRGRREELQLIEQKRQELNEEKRNIAQIMYNIDQQRENRWIKRILKVGCRL